LAYFNYLGQLVPETPAESGNITGTSAGDETINAPAGDTSVSGNGGGDLLVGSTGGNRFYFSDPGDRVLEPNANGGIDTEIGWLTIKLAPNVENLTVHQDFNHGVGNNLDNLMITDGRAWLYGGAGNDVLVGATGAGTTFAVHKGEGSDVIYNWQGLSQLQLSGYGFTSAAQVRSAMTQQGADTVLQLGGGETLTIRNTSPTSFQDKQFLVGLDRSKLGAVTFQDDFNSLSLWDASHKTGTWQTDFGGNLKDAWAYSLIGNGEMQVYTHEGFEGLGDRNLHLDPFSVSNGVLTITAEQIPSSQTAATFGQSWSSGMINTLSSFRQEYGYFEIRAQVPGAQGSWPAFWMVPQPYNGSEADIMESTGINPNLDYRRAWAGDQTFQDNALKLDPSAFHTYGMLWTPTTTTFYIDDVAVMTGATPTSWNTPMGMIVNMALGGWAGAPDASQFPAGMNIDFVRAYALADGSSLVQNLTPDAPYATIQDKAQPGSTPPAQALTFDDTGAALSTGKVVVVDHVPAAADIPQTGRAFVIWETAGQERAAVANNGYLDDTYTVLSAGQFSAYSTHGTFLTDGRVVTSFMGVNDGQPTAFALLFDPATRTYTVHELGPSNGDVSFVALEDGNFAASWHTADGHVYGRAYNAYAYDSKGWWGPVRDLPSDATGVSAQGDLITASGATYAVTPFAITSPDSVSISGPVTKAEGNSGYTDFTFTVTRSDQFWQHGTVAWKVTGIGANPVNASDFAGGWTPSGVVSFQGSQNTATITVRVAGDTVSEANEQFQVTLLNPVGTTLGATVTSTGTISNDDGGTTPPPTSPQIALATSSVTHAEGNSGVTAFSYAVTRTGDTSGASTVNWAVVGSGANPASGADFQGGTAPSGSLSFSAGQASKTITVNVAGDTAVEPNEGFTLTLSGATGATLGTATAAGTITNDDGSTPPPSGGQLLTSTAIGSTLTGGAGDDTLVASMGNDNLTGGAGADVFRLPAEPWAPITVMDFTPGTDKLDLSALFQASGYTGANPVADGYVYLQSDGAGGTLVRYDRDAAGGNPVWPNTIVDLHGVSPNGLTWAQLQGAAARCRLRLRRLRRPRRPRRHRRRRRPEAASC
jgi:beta-glucanase (GH16 family)